ncbi:hypothetical protein PBY51_017989 [Eleginops maclovinus]|nr:hypothetical protein PBY51_017989 [Eleginops maclovinus]
MRLAWNAFLPWLEGKYPGEVHHLEAALESIGNFHDDVSQASLGELMENASCNCIMELRKTNKAALARELEKNVAPADVIPEPSATIIDGMSLVQQMKGDDKTFTQLAESALAKVLHEGAKSQRIDFVFDVYKETSIKDAGSQGEWVDHR